MSEQTLIERLGRWDCGIANEAAEALSRALGLLDAAHVYLDSLGVDRCDGAAVHDRMARYVGTVEARIEDVCLSRNVAESLARTERENAASLLIATETAEAKQRAAEARATAAEALAETRQRLLNEMTARREEDRQLRADAEAAMRVSAGLSTHYKERATAAEQELAKWLGRANEYSKALEAAEQERDRLQEMLNEEIGAHNRAEQREAEKDKALFHAVKDRDAARGDRNRFQREREEWQEAGFRAGYHCQWIKAEQRYIFDPLMKPGDPDGAYHAWCVQAALASPSTPSPAPKETE